MPIKYTDRYGNSKQVMRISFEYFSSEGGVLERVVLTDWICRRFTYRGSDAIELENAVGDVIMIDPRHIVSNIDIQA